MRPQSLRRIRRFPLFPILLVLCALLAAERPAQAYLDPGAGSAAAQVAIAGVAGVLFALRTVLRTWWVRLRGGRSISAAPRR